MAERDLAKVFGGGDDAAPEGGELGDLAAVAADIGMEDEGEEADAPPPDFAVHASEAFPELAGDDARLDALYRTIKSCHPAV